MKAGNKDKTKKEFDELLLEVRRVTRVTTGGRRMSFRATVLVGNRKGKIGVGTAKGADVTIAVSKASREAYKNIVDVPLTKANTVPYETTTKYKSCLVKLLPAKGGTGLKAGSAVRSVLELAGYENMLSKIIGSNNKLNNAIVTIIALGNYKHADFFKNMLEKRANVEETADENTEETTKPVAKKEVHVVKEHVAEKKPVVKEEKIEEAKKPAAKKPAAKKAPAKK
ncbi:MAG: 30S ribosomal protein S5 [Candidatus Absconditabacteria bacterium]